MEMVWNCGLIRLGDLAENHIQNDINFYSFVRAHLLLYKCIYMYA